MQPLPEVPVDGYIEIGSSNKSQARGPHGLFRYFGKLAPDVTGRVLDLAIEVATPTKATPHVVDVMCGSGTTLIESADRGFASTGSDVNPVARLYSQVKTRSIDRDRYFDFLDRVTRAESHGDVQEVFGRTRNSERWFSEGARVGVASIIAGIRELPQSREADALLAVLLGRLRRISNASERTGRIFYDPESAKDPWRDFLDAAKSAADAFPASDLPCTVLDSDARRLPLPDQSADIAFCHPPYFALYRYSSDVLRFELEIGGFSRSATAKREIREGWKSGDPANLVGYTEDMLTIFTEGRRILRPGGCFALTASNSTLGDHLLPVIDGLTQAAGHSGLKLAKHFERKAHHGSASYHRSARADKVIQQDHVLLFTPVP